MTDTNRPTIPPEDSDEISLREIYEIIRKKRLVIIVTTILFAAIAGAYSFIRPTNYAYQACVSMDSLGSNNTMFVDSPQSAIAQLNNVYIPSILSSFVNKQKKINLDSKDFKVFNPKDSSLVCIKTNASKDHGDIISQIQNSVLQRLVHDNAKISAVSKASLENNIKQLQVSAKNLHTEIANVLDQEHAVNTELTLLKTKDTVLQSQSARIKQEIDEMQPLLKKGVRSVHNDSSAFTMMIQNNQVAQEQQQLFKIEMERSVALPKELVSLSNRINTLKRQENDLKSKIAANAAQIKLAQASFKATPITRIVRPSSPSIEPVGEGKGVLIVLGAIIGLILSVFYALLAYALASDKKQNTR